MTMSTIKFLTIFVVIFLLIGCASQGVDPNSSEISSVFSDSEGSASQGVDPNSSEISSVFSDSGDWFRIYSPSLDEPPATKITLYGKLTNEEELKDSPLRRNDLVALPKKLPIGDYKYIVVYFVTKSNQGIRGENHDYIPHSFKYSFRDDPVDLSPSSTIEPEKIEHKKFKLLLNDNGSNSEFFYYSDSFEIP